MLQVIWERFRRLSDRQLLKDGCIQLNDKPGAGFEINPDVAKKYLCEGEKWWD
jgi:L-alanine-DL-glutamate epimerase-like enolase superfamily enzyme